MDRPWSRLRRVVRNAIACAAVFAAMDAAYALVVFGRQHMPLDEFVCHGALAFLIFAGVALAVGVAGLGLGFFVRPAGRALAAPALVFGVVGALWAAAWSDLALLPDVVRPGLWGFAATIGLALLVAGAGIGCVVEIVRRLTARWRTLRFVLTSAGLALFVAYVGLAAAALWQARPAAPSPGRQNVVLITIDALRADYLSCYGGPTPTPHIDALASQGVRFARAASTAPWTRPSVTSILTGVYPSVHGLGEKGVGVRGPNANTLPPRLRTLAEAFAVAGFATQAFVANIQIDARFGVGRGFDDYCMYEPIGTRAARLTLDEAASPGRLVSRRARRIATLRLIDRPAKEVGAGRSEGPSLLAPAGFFAVGSAIRWLRHAPRPFFLWVHLMDVHQYWNFEFQPQTKPSAAPGMAGLVHFACASRLNNEAVEAPWELAGREEPPEVEGGGEQAAGPHDSQAESGDFPKRYRHNLMHEDALVGRLLAEIDRLGLRDSTHVLLTSDHGEEFGEHGGSWHGYTQYEEVTHVPLIVRSPALPAAPAVVAALCSGVDVAPTLATLAGVPLPPTFMGRSLASRLKIHDDDSRPVFSEFTSDMAQERKAVRRGMMKLISANETKPAELYDLATDPREQDNFSGEEPYLLEELTALLRQWEQDQATAAAAIRKGHQRMAIIDGEMDKMLKGLGYRY